LPCITHVNIQKSTLRPHETGVILHLVENNTSYTRMPITDFDLAKLNCRTLLHTYASTFISEVEELSSPDMTIGNRDRAIDLQLTEVHKVAHEFLAILHHYQIHFSNRDRHVVR